MAKRREIRNSTAEFLIFQIEGKEQGVEVYYKDKTVWCTQKAMGMLFDCTSDNISVHLQNIYDTDELKKEATTEKIEAAEESLNALNSQCNTIKDAIIGELKKKLDTSNSTFITDHKTNLDKLARDEKQQLLTFRCDMNNALSNYGFWCSPKVFWWIFGIFYFCFGFTILSIAFLVNGNLHF